MRLLVLTEAETNAAVLDLMRSLLAQRLIEPLVVVNPYARALTFPSNTLRLRREVHKYIGLMNTLALLLQHQRSIQTFTDDTGREHRYVEVTREDVAIANRLIALHLTRALSDLPGTAQKLLLVIQTFVTEESEARGVDPLTVSFSRRQIRERLNWNDYQLNGSLEKLARLVRRRAMDQRALCTLFHFPFSQGFSPSNAPASN